MAQSRVRRGSIKGEEWLNQVRRDSVTVRRGSIKGCGVDQSRVRCGKIKGAACL